MNDEFIAGVVAVGTGHGIVTFDSRLLYVNQRDATS